MALMPDANQALVPDKYMHTIYLSTLVHVVRVDYYSRGKEFCMFIFDREKECFHNSVFVCRIHTTHTTQSVFNSLQSKMRLVWFERFRSMVSFRPKTKLCA